MSREKFLIWQYRTKPKALSTINAIYSETTNTFQSTINIADILNVDVATGYALDLIGSHVGINRVLKQAILKNFFGFADDSAAEGFSYGEFYRYGNALKGTLVLKDDDYRFFIKAKIAKNYQTGTLDNIINSVRYLTGKNSNVVDNQDMTMHIVVNSKSLNTLILYAIRKLDILVRPVGVQYRFLVITNDKPFGFSRDANAFAFGVGQFVRIQNMEISN